MTGQNGKRGIMLAGGGGRHIACKLLRLVIGGVLWEEINLLCDTTASIPWADVLHASNPMRVTIIEFASITLKVRTVVFIDSNSNPPAPLLNKRGAEGDWCGRRSSPIFMANELGRCARITAE